MSTKELQLNSVVTQKIEVAPGLFIIRVAPDGWSLPAFKPGQFAVLGLPASAPRHPLSDPDETPPKPGPIRRAYSIASSSRDNEYLEFYVTVVRSGSLTPRLGMLSIGQRLYLGPKITGLFTFDDVPASANLVLVATGTGLAPYMSMLRTTLDLTTDRRVAVMHGARHSWDLGYRGELLAMERLHRAFSYLAAVSRPDEEPVPWGGEIGYVGDLWSRGLLDARWGFRPAPGDTHVFLCGNPTMIEQMLVRLGADGFREHTRQHPGQIHVEKYW